MYLIGQKGYSLQKVCKDLTKKEAPLTNIDSVNVIDCMGEKVFASSFCKKEHKADPYYIRAVADRRSNKVICKSAKRVIVKFSCEKDDDPLYCDEPEIGCHLIQEKLASSLSLVHHSLNTQVRSQKVLDCYFAVNEIEKLPEKKRKWSLYNLR